MERVRTLLHFLRPETALSDLWWSRRTCSALKQPKGPSHINAHFQYSLCSLAGQGDRLAVVAAILLRVHLEVEVEIEVEVEVEVHLHHGEVVLQAGLPVGAVCLHPHYPRLVI